MQKLFSYGQVTPEIIQNLQTILGENNVSLDEEKIEAYSHDEVLACMYKRKYNADALIFPESTEQVSAVMKLASAHKIPVTPRGAGTGLSGGDLPVCGGILMCFEKMNHILELDEENLSVTVEPGVVTAEISRLAAAHNLLYAGDPCSGDASYIGGNIAENAGGNKVIKYGATGAQLLALEVVLADGSVTWFGGKRRKDVTGFDFVHLMAGSEGVLAIVTKAVLKLLPLPKNAVDLLVTFDDPKKAISFVPKIMSEEGLIPASLEFMDHKALALAEKYRGQQMPGGEAAASLIIQLEDNNSDRLEEQYEAVGKLSLKNGATEVFVADTRTTKDRIWQARKTLPEAVSATFSKYAREDLVVPMSKVPELLEAIKTVADERGFEWVAYGHAGDGNMHAFVVVPDKEGWHDVLGDVLGELYAKVLALGGTISGEHGIGYKRKGYMSLFLDKAQIELIKRVKLAFDPQNILNPGKIVEWGEEQE